MGNSRSLPLYQGVLVARGSQKLLKRSSERPRERHKLDIRDKSLTGFDPLNGVLVDVETEELKARRQHPLRHTRCSGTAQAVDGRTAQIAFSVLAFVFKHIVTSFLWGRSKDLVPKPLRGTPQGDQTKIRAMPKLCVPPQAFPTEDRRYLGNHCRRRKRAFGLGQGIAA